MIRVLLLAAAALGPVKKEDEPRTDLCTFLRAALMAQPNGFVSIYGPVDHRGDHVPSTHEVNGAQICRIITQPGEDVDALCIWNVKALDADGRKARLDALRTEVQSCVSGYTEIARGGGLDNFLYVAPNRPRFLLSPTDEGEIYLIIPGPTDRK